MNHIADFPVDTNDKEAVALMPSLRECRILLAVKKITKEEAMVRYPQLVAKWQDWVDANV